MSTAAQVVLPSASLDETLAFFTDRLGFRVEAIFPADDPSVAVVVGHGVRVRLDRNGQGAPGVLRLEVSDPDAFADGERALEAPNGTRIEIADIDPPITLPPEDPSFVLTRFDAETAWGVGRAGMRYRDLIPNRQGGRFIASHISIPDGGPVPDYVHFHKVRFQMIYCYRGWVKVVYEDQGPPFVLQAGDCVLQPPRIRHRVLEASPGLEVIEIGCPADHETRADLEMELPTGRVEPGRDFSGQRFCRHVAAEASWSPWRREGFEARDIGIGAATDGLAGVRVARPTADVGRGASASKAHDGELQFWFVLGGTVTLERDGHGPERLQAGDTVVVPAGLVHALREPSPDLNLLDVTLPALLA
jgi:quercetin dioxygenase-like cupin family protein